MCEFSDWFHKNQAFQYFKGGQIYAALPSEVLARFPSAYASLLISQGENPKYIQNQMGHSSIQVTYDIYGHLIATENSESASKLGNTIFGENSGFGSRMVAK